MKGLRFAGTTKVEQANAYLESDFLPWWNATLRVEPAHPGGAHHPLCAIAGPCPVCGLR